MGSCPTTAGRENLVAHRAYGFRSFHNYRLRVIAQCGLPSIHTPSPNFTLNPHPSPNFGVDPKSGGEGGIRTHGSLRNA